FQDVVAARGLAGVILAHQADDQAETVLQRLLRNSPPGGLVGMSRVTTIAGLQILRPLLAVKHADLVAHLQSIGQSWRDDASNQSDAYERNRLRKLLSQHAALSDSLIDVATTFGALREWI